MDHPSTTRQAALNLMLKLDENFTSQGASLIIQAANTQALLAIADAITSHTATTRPPAAPSPDWPRWRKIDRASLPGEAPGIHLLTCTCGSNQWSRYPTRSPGGPPPLNWWVCSNPACFRVVDADGVHDDGSPIYAYEPGNQY